MSSLSPDARSVARMMLAKMTVGDVVEKINASANPLFGQVTYQQIVNVRTYMVQQGTPVWSDNPHRRGADAASDTSVTYRDAAESAASLYRATESFIAKRAAQLGCSVEAARHGAALFA